jgi:hypothetical protein
MIIITTYATTTAAVAATTVGLSFLGLQSNYCGVDENKNNNKKNKNKKNWMLSSEKAKEENHYDN